jgi:glycosyltransferase involved in cell wall biosynthesis
MSERSTPIAAIIIGRNEGARLQKALMSFATAGGPIIYVDSGSHDDSVALAKSCGADVVELDMGTPFTAARARNAGFIRLMEMGQVMVGYVQFMDGDCSLSNGWLDSARQFLDAHADVAVVCGRRRERFPEASVYNRLIDLEWDTPIGEARACGGDALMRIAAVDQVGGYNSALIAGEEPDMCLRMRRVRWRIWRLDAEMTWHDAALVRFGQWWNRARRAGHSYAEGAALHGRTAERYNVAQTRRALVWGAALPLGLVIGVLITPWAVLLAGLWALKILKLRVSGMTWAQSFFLTVGNLPEAQGALGYYIGHLRGTKHKLI